MFGRNCRVELRAVHRKTSRTRRTTFGFRLAVKAGARVTYRPIAIANGVRVHCHGNKYRSALGYRRKTNRVWHARKSVDCDELVDAYRLFVAISATYVNDPLP